MLLLLKSHGGRLYPSAPPLGSPPPTRFAGRMRGSHETMCLGSDNGGGRAASQACRAGATASVGGMEEPAGAGRIAKADPVSYNVPRFMTPREPSESWAEGCPAPLPSYSFWCLRR